MSTQPVTPQGVPMFGPDGQIHLIPNDQVDAAQKSGGEMAHQMKAPDGSLRYVSHSQLGDALRSGGVPLAATDMGSMAQHTSSQPSAPQTSDNIADALQNSTISPPETGAAAAIDRFKNKIRDLMGADRPGGDALGGMVLGPMNAAHGAAITPSHPIRGINQMVSGIGQTAALPMAIANPGFMAESAPYLVAQQGTKALASNMGADPDVSEFLGNLAIPGAALGMKGTQAAARIAQNNPSVTNAFLGLAGGGSALHDLISGRPLDAAKSAVVTAAIKAGIGIAADGDIPNPISKLTDYLRAGPQRDIIPPSQKALPGAPTELGASPDTSGSVSSAPPAYANNTRASRLGLLLNSGEQPAIPLGPSSATPQTVEGVLPAARKVLNNGNVQFLTRPLNPGEMPDVAKNTNSNLQDYFIQKMRDGLERPTVSGESEQEAAMQRMAEYAKTPVDKAGASAGTASGPVESSAPQFAYRTRDAGTTGIMPNANKTAQASLDPAKVQSYMPGRGQAQNAAQELVRVDLSKLDPSEYEVKPNGYVNFKSAVPESFIEKMGGDTPRVPTSDADMMDLLMKSVQKAKGKAQSAKAGD